METSLQDRAQKRARRSVLFGLIWLFIGLTWLSLMWLSDGRPLETLIPKRLSPAGVALANILSILEKTGFILWVGSGVACVITAFPQPENPRTWQGRTAVFLAFLVLLISLTSAFCLWIWY
jgi:uncharacterized membrane protein YwaF